jgi:hypothetical protein
MSAIGHPKLFNHVFQSFNRDAYNEINDYVDSNPIPKVWIRYGLQTGDQGKMTDWELHTIVSVKSNPSSTADTSLGDFFTMVTADFLYVMQKDERVSTRKGRISDMVQAMATVAGFEKFSIEPTDLDYALVQTFQSDYDFITNRLLPIASNKDSASSFLLFTRGEFIHFHTANYQLSGVYEFNYGSSVHDATNISISNMGNSNEILQINGLNLVAVDPLQGVTINWKTNPSRELILSDSSPQRAGVSYKTGHVGQNQLSNMYAESQWQYSIDKASAYEFEFTISNYPYIGVGDVVSSKLQRGQGDRWEGLYLVKKVTHSIENSRVLSHYKMTRGEYVSQDGVPAQGKKLSGLAVDSSGLTSGTSGGFQNESGMVVEVNDPGRA